MELQTHEEHQKSPFDLLHFGNPHKENDHPGRRVPRHDHPRDGFEEERMQVWSDHIVQFGVDVLGWREHGEGWFQVIYLLFIIYYNN